MKVISFLLFIFPFLLLGEVIESYSKKSVQVGEESTLQVKFQTGDVEEWNLPTKGLIYSESDLEMPLGELLEISQTSNEITFRYVYFSSGNFKSSLSWKNKDGEIVNSQEILEVKSVLTGEKEPLDISEPLIFSGSYLLRIILIILGALVFISIIAYILFYFNNKKKVSIKDAIFEKVETGENPDFYKEKLHQMLLNSEMSHKDFIFHLSGYIKERIGNKFNTSVLHLTQSEIHEILQKNYQVANVELLTIDNYFNSVKYMPNEEKISRDNALGLIKYWDRILIR